MIDCYCKVCGLFISIPDEYAGGSGACPRCRTPLRIPRPLTTESPDYVAGQRYIAQILTPANSDDTPSIVTPDMGPSRKYKCSGCGQVFESLSFEPHVPGYCPACKKDSQPIGQPAEFPRYLATKSDAKNIAAQQPEKPQQKDDNTVDGYFILQPIESGDMDVIIEGIAVDADGNEINAVPDVKSTADTPISISDAVRADISPETPKQAETPQQAEKRVSHPLSRSRPQVKPSKNLPSVQNIPEGQWTYFIKGKVEGPLDTKSFRELFLRGELSQSVLVWRHGMDNWQPADAFEELKVEVPTITPGEITFHDDASTAAMKILASRLQFLLWLAVILWIVVILMFLTRKTLEDLGIHAYFTSVIVLLSFSLAGLGTGVMLIVKHSRSFIKSGSKAFAEWLSAMVAFVCAIAVAFSVYTHFDPTPIFSNVEYYQTVSRDGFDSLYAGNFNDTLNRVNWNDFVFNDRNVGKEYKAATTQKQRMLIIAEVMDQLRTQVNAIPTSAPASQPTTKPAAKQPATKPTVTTQPAQQLAAVFNWLVIKQTIGETEVLGRTSNGHKIHVTVSSGMITKITIR